MIFHSTKYSFNKKMPYRPGLIRNDPPFVNFHSAPSWPGWPREGPSENQFLKKSFSETSYWSHPIFLLQEIMRGAGYLPGAIRELGQQARRGLSPFIGSNLSIIINNWWKCRAASVVNIKYWLQVDYRFCWTALQMHVVPHIAVHCCPLLSTST